MTKIQLRRGMSVWDATGKTEQTGFAKTLNLLPGARNHRGMVQVQCPVSSRRGWVHPDEIAKSEDNPGETQRR